MAPGTKARHCAVSRNFGRAPWHTEVIWTPETRFAALAARSDSNWRGAVDSTHRSAPPEYRLRAKWRPPRISPRIVERSKGLVDCAHRRSPRPDRGHGAAVIGHAASTPRRPGAHVTGPTPGHGIAETLLGSITIRRTKWTPQRTVFPTTDPWLGLIRVCKARENLIRPKVSRRMPRWARRIGTVQLATHLRTPARPGRRQLHGKRRQRTQLDQSATGPATGSAATFCRQRDVK